MDSRSDWSDLEGVVKSRGRMSKIRRRAVARNVCPCPKCVALDPSRAAVAKFQKEEVQRVIKRAELLPDGPPPGEAVDGYQRGRSYGRTLPIVGAP